ncbi:translocation/assembly module TamB domain-containing protein [Shewanella sp. D64]|uniref:autotransporter assembly complex protein TamB n=1 Tax=unclassified Shewanella TaxID=196818 RepID=UPI0022BA6A84|nr:MULTISPECIES: translocation/assembly module TamB domain-containing protein [unclassified Shewanella]MEC4725384.1 translocation/assembly module TamB domain-containing protein [Shewanella sp. D64]MEC4735770.1 translocation/assembly module TamB domain-containing protein [Shewanella sp. E94]WBJ93257.1 translocation/assembly module TamB domain-containing protein [Shewanella sp. MTB7]
MSQSLNRESNTEQESKPSNGTMMLKYCWRRFKTLSRILIYIPLSLLIIIAILIGTDFGGRITVFLASTFVPDLDITYVSGTINSQLEVKDAHWQMDGIRVDIKELKLQWLPMCLLKKQLCVDKLIASNILVEIDTDKLAEDDTLESKIALEQSPSIAMDSKDDDYQEIQLPFGIDLQHANLAGVKVRVDDMHFNADRLQTQAQWQQTGIRVSYLYSQGLFVSIPIDTKTKANSTTKHKDGEWAMAHLPEVFIPIPVFVSDAQLSDSLLKLGNREDTFKQINLQASYHSFLIHVEKLEVEHTYGKVDLDGEISLKNDYPMDFTAAIDLNHVKELPELNPQKVSLKTKGGFKKLALSATGSGHISFSLDGDIGLASPDLPYHLKLKSKQLAWPLDNPVYTGDSVVLASHGDLNQQSVVFSGLINTPYQPQLNIDTAFEHSGSEITLSHLNANGEIGKLVASGTANYDNNITWDADISLTKFKLEQLKLELENPLPASLITGQLHTQGAFRDNEWQVGISKSDLSGEIQGYPFQLLGDISVNSELNLSADNLTLNALQSVLTISGKVKNIWAVNALLDVPNINLWHPDASGSIKAKIKVSGDSDHPEIDFTASVLDIKFKQIELEQTQIKGFYQPRDAHQFALSLKANNLSWDNIDIDSITFGTKGNEKEQKMSLQTFGELQLNTKVFSTFNPDTEKLAAQIHTLSLNSQIGPWALKAPFEITWDNKSQSGVINTFCWQHKDGNLCLDDVAELGPKGDVTVSFNGDIGSLLTPLLPEKLSWVAPATLNSQFSWQPNNKPTGFLTLNFEPGHISLNNNSRNLDIGYKLLNLQVQLDEKMLSTQIKFDSHDIATWEGQLDIKVTPDRVISGYTKLHQINLAALSEFMPQLERLGGKVSSELTISGTLNKPDISGEVLLQRGELLIAANPTLLEDINLSLKLSGQRAKVDGHWLMGEGKANLNGVLNWGGEDFMGDMVFNGKNLAIIQPPFALINVSPDLNIKFKKDSLNIQGTLDIPSGNIRVVQLPEGGVAVSSDVVFEDSISSGEKELTPLAFTTNIKINVADKLKINGMGLRGRLTGTLDLMKEALNPPLLYGDIRVIDGTYKFLGQTLDIKTGEVQFIGPLSVPNLNIEAVRNIKDGDVIAGVKITGTPHKPIVTLFSSPEKEQAEILSYIIKGTGFRSDDADENSSFMMGAALALGNQLDGGVVNNIGNSATDLIEKIGFTNVQLDANDDGRVAISGFIGEDLMVKYGVGVFNPGYEITVRYYLLSQLYLESVSGTIEQSLDIYYNFDID